MFQRFLGLQLASTLRILLHNPGNLTIPFKPDGTVWPAFVSCGWGFRLDYGLTATKPHFTRNLSVGVAQLDRASVF